MKDLKYKWYDGECDLICKKCQLRIGGVRTFMANSLYASFRYCPNCAPSKKELQNIIKGLLYK